MNTRIQITPQLHPKKRHPYYIVAPDYRRTSAGIRIMHQLCDAIRKMGFDAWILANVTHPGLNTPRLTDEIAQYHHGLGLKPIAIYPEIIGANPLNTGLVVRYILNIPGLLGERPQYKESDLFYAHTPEMLPAIGHPAKVLNMPPTDTSIFNNIDNENDLQREGHCIYFGRFREGAKEYAHLMAGATEITGTFPATQEEMAKLFRKSKLLYCFENTAISMEARLCGCPAVILPSPFFNKKMFFGGDLGFDKGVAFSEAPEEIQRARDTLPEVTALFPTMEQNFWQQLADMLETTQREAEKRPRHATEPTVQSEAPESPDYQQWRKLTAFSASDAQLLAERMMLQWAQRPGIHLFMPAAAGSRPLIQQTVDSLEHQLYPEWLLTVVTTDDPPTALKNHPRVQWLSLRDPKTSAYVVDALVPNSPGQWLARLAPGTLLAPESLLMLADAAQAHPEWRLMYCDDDELRSDGVRHSPRLKPGFNLDLLRCQDYVGPVVWVEKSSLEASGLFGDRPVTDHYDLTLRVFDKFGEAAMGHVPEVLVHLRPAPPCEDDLVVAHNAELKSHLERNGQRARVLRGLQLDTRQLIYAPPTRISISVIVSVFQGAEWLHPLLESLATMSPQALEVVLLLNPNAGGLDAQATAALLQKTGLQKRSSVIEIAENESAAACWNLAADRAQGEILLFLEDGTQLLQHDLPVRMAGLVNRPDVAVVAPRLLDPVNGKLAEGPVFLGIGGLISGAWHQTELSDPGYMGRAWCEQNVCAVNPSAWMISRQRFLDLGGADTALKLKNNALLDLCLRAVKAGLRNVWSPGSSLLQHQFETQQAVDPILAKRDEELIWDRWAGNLANDPAYHPRLTLDQPFALEAQHVVPWRGQSTGKQRILGVLEGSSTDSPITAWLNQMNHRGNTQTGWFEHCLFDLRHRTLLIEIARARPDWVILDKPLSPAQQALGLAIKRHVPSIRLAAVLGSAPVKPSINPLGPLDTDLQAIVLRPLLRQLDCLFLDSADLVPRFELAAGQVEILPEESLESERPGEPGTARASFLEKALSRTKS